VRITRLAQFYLPGAALLAGVLVWFFRVRGSRRAPAPTSSSTAA
jgi:hypothetical protein